MDSVEVELQAAASEVLTALRQGRGLNEHQATRLKAALSAACREWSGRDTISKSAASLFVDLAHGLESCAYAYPSEEAMDISKLADQVGDLVRACVETLD
jgi:hypothetical protein